MSSGFYLITGTSRGIGRALGAKLIEKGNTVMGVSRSASDEIRGARYHHLTIDMGETSRIGEIVRQAAGIARGDGFELLCLVNNASPLEPLAAVENAPPTEIESHIRTAVIGAMVLTSMFMREFNADAVRKKIAFISSGAGIKPLPGASVYSTGKAALNMFAQCIGVEQADKEGGFESISISPGMVDTAMQTKARSLGADEFASAERFKQAHAAGKLQSPDAVAEKICAVLLDRYEPGRYLRLDEIRGATR